MNEDQLLIKVDIETALARLDPADRDMMVLIYRLERPVDWGRRRWPPTYDDIGDYVGRKHEHGPLSEAAIRYRRDVVQAQWQGLRGHLRRNR